MNNPICYVMVGLPASGKSTRVDEMSRMIPDAYVYSTDGILERIAEQLGKTYNDVFEKHIKSAQTEADIWLADAMKHKLDIIWDQTNLGFKKRRSIINRMRQAGYAVECECILFPQGDSQQEDWQHRLSSRPGKTIPPKIVESMMDSFIRPTVEEGFDRVTYCDIYGNIVDQEGVTNNE